MVSPMTDQIFAAYDEVEKKCGANSHLMNDLRINALMQDAATRRNLPGGLFAEVPSMSEAFVRPAVIEYRRRNLCPYCERRWTTYNWRIIDIPMGHSIVRLRLCPGCAFDLGHFVKPQPVRTSVNVSDL